jgi:hypothetical protein
MKKTLANSEPSTHGISATFTRRGAMSEVHSAADISRIADPAVGHCSKNLLFSRGAAAPLPFLIGGHRG